MKDKIKMNGYQKIKFIINEFLKKRAVSARDSIFEYNGISIDTVQNIITKLNKANMIYKFDKETNKIKNDLIDKTIFSNDNYNNNFISSIISREEVNSENTIKYFFKQVPDNLIFMTNNKYSINFNDQIIPLLDSKKYNAFSSLIINNTDIHKSTCRINHEEDIVPLELFIYGSSWYVCAHNIKTKENIIIDSYNIKYFQKLNEYYSLYINDKQITETIEKFIKESVKEEYFFLKLKPELLNMLLNFKLIDEEYTVYDEEKELNNKDFVNISEKLIENEIIPKIKLFHINISNLEEEKVLNDSTLPFSKKDSKKYIFKIKTSNYKYILDNFPDIKTIDINEYIIL